MNPGARRVLTEFQKGGVTRTSWASNSSFAYAEKVTPESSPYVWTLIEFNFILMSRTVNWVPNNSFVLDYCLQKAAEHTLKRTELDGAPGAWGT